MEQPKNILVRLPNWLGDMVMSTAFLVELKHQYPSAIVDVICKKELEFLVKYLPNVQEHYSFSKESYKGIGGAWKFGKSIHKKKDYDLFFCLPNSLSSAIMAKATGSKQIIGYKKELRSFFLTHSYPIPKNIHRVEAYLQLLSHYVQQNLQKPEVHLMTTDVVKAKTILININSEADSRRLPFTKAVSIINTIRNTNDSKIVLIGAPKEAEFVTSVYDALDNKENIENQAGKTSIDGLITLMQTATLMLTTDSGPAHVANALGVHTVVLFGAGNEAETAPYNTKKRTIIRLGKLPCEPCVSNTCKRFEQPECLLQLSEQLIADAVNEQLANRL